jgi:predicted RNase H-like HicB family nuclease
MKSWLYPIIVERMEEGGFYAECPVFQGCHVEGDTYAEALENLEDAIRIMIESYREIGQALPVVPSREGQVVLSSLLPIPAGA